jgi:hypothetical protein
VDDVERSAAVTFAPALDTPGRARQFVRDVLFAWDHRPLTDAAQLVVSELVTNAVLHGGRDVVIVRLLIDGPRLRIEVSDGNARTPPQLRASQDESSRGLHLVDAYASAWGFVPTGDRKTVWCEIPLVAGDARLR